MSPSIANSMIPLTAARSAVRSEPRLLERPFELSASEAARVRGRRVLLALAHRGHVPQEVLKPMARLEAAGCEVTPACLDADHVQFDFLTTMLAVLEGLWDPTIRLLARASRRGRFRNVPSLRDLERTGQLASWLDRFDAVIVPGGHGRVLDEFFHDPIVLATIRHFHRSERAVGLICHATLIAAQADEAGDALCRDRVMVSWPRAADRFNRSIPLLGPFLVPYARPVGESLARAGAHVHDGMRHFPRVHAAIDGQLVTARGPWSDGPFVAALLHVLASAPARTGGA